MQNNYYELTITLDDALVDFIADFILNIYNEGLEFGDGKIIVRGEQDLTFVKEALVALTDKMPHPIVMHYHLEEKENIDWVKSYQDSIEPIEVGKFYIFPSWYPPKDNAINIKIDPTLAFGSGHHATTFSCLQAISDYVTSQSHVVDVGCGSGILGLACSKLGAKVDLCDTDPVSVSSTKENFLLNQETYHSLWEGSMNSNTQTYDVVIANIVADVLRFIAKDLKKACKKDGILILSGILDTKEDLVQMSFSNLTLNKRIVTDEWITLIYQT